MDNKKDNKYYVQKIVTDLAFIMKHTSGLTPEELDSNEILLDSVMFRLIQISENSDKLTADFKAYSRYHPSSLPASFCRPGGSCSGTAGTRP